MNIMVIGSGGREHALAWKLSTSSLVKKVWVVPGNAGIGREIKCVNIKPTDFYALVDFARKNKIDITIVGPELPLVNGISDCFKENGLKIFGPVKKAAMLEGSKVWAKQFMERHNIPTAEFRIFESHRDAVKYLKATDYPVVIKADGLAAGKGSVIVDTPKEAEEVIEKMMIKKIFGSAGERIVVEKKVEGQEISLLAFVSKDEFLTLLPAQDHKQIFDGDKGPNTGGMGAYAPVPFADKELIDNIEKNVFKPTINGLLEEGIEYYGILYAGLMVRNSTEFDVLEFNVRFGDPETQPLLFLMKSDLMDITIHCVEGSLRDCNLKWHRGFATGVVVAAKGYPLQYRKGDEIFIDEEWFSSQKDVKIFFSGVAAKGNSLITNGGRVATIVARGSTLADSIDKAYEGVNHINFAGMYYRKDIGKKGLI